MIINPAEHQNPLQNFKNTLARPHRYGLSSVGLGLNLSLGTFKKSFNGDSDMLSVENFHSAESTLIVVSD